MTRFAPVLTNTVEIGQQIGETGCQDHNLGDVGVAGLSRASQGIADVGHRDDPTRRYGDGVGGDLAVCDLQELGR